MSTDNGRPASCWKSVSKFLCSHVGMCIMVILYCIAGGFVFEHLEKDNEIQICKDSRKEYDSIEKKTLDKFRDINQMTPNETLSILQMFRDSCVSIGYTGDVCELIGKENGTAFSWSLPGAILFSITIVSTIGYGHITPKTTWGRLVCIAYAVIGIPLMLICLANIGDALADVFRFVYAKIICCRFCKRKKKSEMKQSLSNRNVHMVNSQIMMNDSPLQTANNLDSKVRPVSKFMNEKPPQNVSVNDSDDNFYESHYETTNFMVSNENSNPIDTPHIRSRPMTSYNCDNKPLKIYPVPLAEREPVILVDESDYDDDDDDDDKDSASMSIPLTITMMVIAVYIMFGAMLFKLWEGWDLLQSVYFCFITLSTIGFGDVVPGTDFDNPQTNIQMIIGGFYILFGMAIVSMCFSLMQEEMVSKFKMLMGKLGFMTDDN